MNLFIFFIASFSHLKNKTKKNFFFIILCSFIYYGVVWGLKFKGTFFYFCLYLGGGGLLNKKKIFLIGN